MFTRKELFKIKYEYRAFGCQRKCTTYNIIELIVFFFWNPEFSMLYFKNFSV